MAKNPPWTPSEEAVQELLDAASYTLKDDDIYPADAVKPQADGLRELLNGWLTFGIHEVPTDGEDMARTFACLKVALLRAKSELEAREYMRKALQREETRAKERLSVLETVAWEMLEAYGQGERLELHTPLGDIRRQRNSEGSVWVDEERIDEIPEKIGEIELVKVKKTPVKNAIGAYLEDLQEQARLALEADEAPPEIPDWAHLTAPGYHLRYS